MYVCKACEKEMHSVTEFVERMGEIYCKQCDSDAAVRTAPNVSATTHEEDREGQWSSAIVAQLQNSTPIIFIGVRASSDGEAFMKRNMESTGTPGTVFMSDDPRPFHLPHFRMQRCWLDFSFYVPGFKGQSLSKNELTTWAKDLLREANYDVAKPDEWTFIYSPPSDENFRMKLNFRWLKAMESPRVAAFVHGLDDAVKQRGGHY